MELVMPLSRFFFMDLKPSVEKFWEAKVNVESSKKTWHQGEHWKF